MSKKRTSGPPVRPVALSAITVDAGIQPRAGELNQEHVGELADALARGDKLPPLVVYRDTAADTWWLSEGFHRCAAYRRAGKKDAPCEVREGTRDDAELNALGSNRDHGLKRTNADKRRAVERLLAKYPDWSNPRIAEHAAVSDEFVRTVRAESQPPTVGGSRTGRDGKTRRAPQGIKPPECHADQPADPCATVPEESVRPPAASGHEPAQLPQGDESRSSNRSAPPIDDLVRRKPDELESVEPVTTDDVGQDGTGEGVRGSATAEYARDVERAIERLDGPLTRFVERLNSSAAYRLAFDLGLPHTYDPETGRFSLDVAAMLRAFVREIETGANP